ncbi:MAG: hypothetical protein ACLTSX_07135 [Collinsella sp.]
MKQRLGLRARARGRTGPAPARRAIQRTGPRIDEGHARRPCTSQPGTGVTMVISSHVLDQLDRMATSFGVIRSGRMVRELSMDDLHRECGNSIRIRTNDPARTLAILEEALPGTALRAEPTGRFSRAQPYATPPRASGAPLSPPWRPPRRTWQGPSVKHGLLILELSHVERDIEEYFVELMGGADA